MSPLPFWRSRSVRRIAVQAAFIALLVAGLGLAIVTAHINLAAQNMTSGFAFLLKSTAWEMNFALLPVSRDDPYWWFMLMGVLNTLFMGLIGLTGATAIGLIVGLMRSGRNPAARLLGTIYIEVFRNLPLIVQLYFWYAVATSLPSPRQALQANGFLASSRGLYTPGLGVSYGAAVQMLTALAVGGLAAVWFVTAQRFRKVERPRRRAGLWAILGVTLATCVVAALLGHAPGTPWITTPELAGLSIRGGIRIQPEILSLALAIMLYGGAYVGEIVRGGFKAVGRGQIEAARALGLTNWQVFARIRMPLAFRAMLPILINQYVWLIKATTLGIAVGFSDFFMVIATSITHSGQTLELIGILMAGFLCINFTLAAVLNRLNRAIALKGNLVGVAT